MNAAMQITRLTEDLAAQWTEPLLELLRAAGMQRITVEREIEAWHTLTALLRAELRWQRVFRSATTVSVNALREQVLHQAILILGRPMSWESEWRLREMIRARPLADSERRLYAQLVRQPLRSALKPLSRTDFVPLLQPV